MGNFSFSNVLSDLSTKAQAQFSNIGDAAIKKASGQILSFMKVGAPPQGNLTAKQVESGQVGAPVQGNAKNGFMGIPLPALLIGGAVGLALLLKR